MAGGQILRIVEQRLGPERCELRLDGELDLWSSDLFLQIRRRLEADGGRLAIYGCSAQVLRIFTVAALTEAGIVFASRDEAIAEPAVAE